MLENSIDLLILTETWLRDQGDEVAIGELTPPGHKFLSSPRSSSNYGGDLGTLYREELRLQSLPTGQSFAHLNTQVLLIYPKVSITMPSTDPLPQQKMASQPINFSLNLTCSLTLSIH